MMAPPEDSSASDLVTSAEVVSLHVVALHHLAEAASAVVEVEVSGGSRELGRYGHERTHILR